MEKIRREVSEQAPDTPVVPCEQSSGGGRVRVQAVCSHLTFSEDLKALLVNFTIHEEVHDS